MALNVKQAEEMLQLAKEKELFFMEVSSDILFHLTVQAGRPKHIGSNVKVDRMIQAYNCQK